MILSILIPTLQNRSGYLNQLMAVLRPQLNKNVEVIFDNSERPSTGNKRNALIQASKGKYVVFVDDDDLVSEDYVEQILKAAELDKDCIVFKGWMTTNGRNKCGFELSIHHPYEAINRNGKTYYLRYPNHITPIKREIAKTVLFENRTIGEDFAWATELNEKKLLKSEAKIDKELYFYLYRSNK